MGVRLRIWGSGPFEIVGLVESFVTYEGQHARIVLDGLTESCDTVVYPFGQFNGPKLKRVFRAKLS